MYDLLKRSTQALLPDTIAFARDLIRTPSPTLGENNVASLILAKMRAYGYDDVFTDAFGNVVGVIHGRENSPTVLLNTHMDTVAADCSGTWTSNPYEGELRDGRLIGLGAADCKGGIAAHLAVGAAIKRSLLPLRGNLVVAATVAEESGTSAGVRGLLSKTLPKLDLMPTLVLLGEPTNLGLYYGHDGWMQVELTIESPNAFHVEDVARAVYDAMRKEGDQASSNASHEEMQVEAPIMSDQGGSRRATLRINRRLTAPMQERNVVSQIRRNAAMAAQSIGRVAIRVDVSEESQTLYNGVQTISRKLVDAWQTDPFDPMLERSRQCLAAAGCEVRPGKWRLGRLGMGTAGGVITREFNIPAIGYGPGNEEEAHAPNESVDTNMIAEATYGTAAIVHGLAGIPVMGWTADEI